jgi:hypothetical protein
VNAIKNGWEEKDNAPRGTVPTSGIDEGHKEQVKSFLEHMHSISCMAAAKQVRISAASFYSILTISLGKRKVCAKWIPHILKDDQRAMHVLLATIHLHWRN